MSQSRRRILLISSVLLVPFTLVAFQVTTRLLGPRLGYLVGFGLYWGYTLIVAGSLSHGRQGYLHNLLRQGALTRPQLLWSALCFVPVLGVFFISFLPNVAALTSRLWLLVVLTAAVNGFVEELYWRGLYLREFGDDGRIGLWLATGLFGAWHVSLYLIEGISYRGGLGALVGGATMMGLLWSYASRRVGNIAASSMAHSLVNTFAFTGLYIDNGF
jgi:hypothetical protein